MMRGWHLSRPTIISAEARWAESLFLDFPRRLADADATRYGSRSAIFTTPACRCRKVRMLRSRSRWLTEAGR